MELQIIKTEGELKADIDHLSSTIIQSITEGQVNPLHILATVKSYEKVFDNIKKEVINGCLNEAEKYTEKEFKAFGVKFTKQEAGVMYDYSGCSHLDYNEVCEKIAALNQVKKDYEKLLLAIKSMTPMVSINGEMMEVYPPAKKSTTTLKVNI